MADIHIEEFYKDSAIALLQLYAAFPRPIALYVEDIAGPDTPDEYGIHSPRHMACFGALLWLADEGFLRFQDSIRQEALDQAVLTRSAFTLLSTHAPKTLVEKLLDKLDLDNPQPPEPATHAKLLEWGVRSRSSQCITRLVSQILFDINHHQP